MARSKSSKVILGLVIVIIVCAAGVAAGIAIFNKNGSNDTKDATKTASSSSNETSKAPPKTSNPKDVLAKIQSYVGQEVTLNGVISKVQNDYYLVGLDKEKPGAIKLDFTKTSLDPAKYLGQPAKGSVPSTPTENVKVVQSTVSVTGKVSQKNTSSQPSLIVESVKQN